MEFQWRFNVLLEMDVYCLYRKTEYWELQAGLLPLKKNQSSCMKFLILISVLKYFLLRNNFEKRYYLKCFSVHGKGFVIFFTISVS